MKTRVVIRDVDAQTHIHLPEFDACYPFASWTNAVLTASLRQYDGVLNGLVGRCLTHDCPSTVKP